MDIFFIINYPKLAWKKGTIVNINETEEKEWQKRNTGESYTTAIYINQHNHKHAHTQTHIHIYIERERVRKRVREKEKHIHR